MHILGQKFISISIGPSHKKEIEKWLLRTSVQCISESVVIVNDPKILNDLPISTSVSDTEMVQGVKANPLPCHRF